MTNLKNKVVIITGASSGIGEATAILLASLGARVILAARNSASLEKVAEKIRNSNGEVLCVVTDVKKRNDLLNLVQQAKVKYGKVDVIVNNAGAGPISKLDELKVEEWEDMIDVNVKGVLYGIAAILPVFREQKSGHIINIISTAGIKMVPTMAVYAGTKNAVRTITEILRQEVSPDIRVTGISPGLVQTNFLSSISDDLLKLQYQKGMNEIGMSPTAIARAVVYCMEQPMDVNVSDIVIRPTSQS